ncbi:MAG: sensor histidine kinase [Vicinamibacterales bacterium]
MSARPRQFPHRVLLTSAILALVTAATLVAYLEQRAHRLQQQQNHVIIQQMCERTATVVAGRIRHLLDQAFFETLEGIGHPEVMRYDLPRVASYFANGLQRHPYVDRFFIWSVDRSPLATDQVVFYSPVNGANAVLGPIRAPDGRELGSLVSEPELGREILRLARSQSERKAFLVVERTVGRTPYQLIIHPLWSDDRRHEFSAIIGYTVDLQKIGRDVFQRLLAEDLKAFLNPDSRSPRLAATLLDDAGRVVYGEPVMPGLPAAHAPVNMLFFPHEPLNQWLAGQPPVRKWQVVVSAAGSLGDQRVSGTWVVAAVVLLIVIAVVCAVAVERQARKLSRMQADFVANASHQLKTPLSLLSTAIETLCLDRVPSERMKEYLKILLAQTRRMTSLVERILHFSRLDAGPDIYRMEPVDLVPLVESVITRFTIDGHQGPVPITFERGTDRVMARADASAIEQMVVNLLENAIKYGDERNRVSVRVAQSNGHAAISVRDRGFGIHASDVAHIFDKFYRGRTGGDGRPGFGLGLALVDAIARAHGGRALVETRYRQGSEFTVMIPAMAKDDPDGVSDSRD